MSDYLPVMLSIDHPHPELEEWVVTRFELLNGAAVQVIRRQDLPQSVDLVQPQYLKAWLWDLVPAATQRILFLDFDIIPLRPLPEMPDVPFIASPDVHWYDARMRAMYPSLADGHYFNAGFFVAHRDTQPCFEQLKSFAVAQGYNAPYENTFEQTPFNHLIQSQFAVHWLPHTVHCMAHTDYPELPTACLLHLAGVQGELRWVVMETVRMALAGELTAG